MTTFEAMSPVEPVPELNFCHPKSISLVCVAVAAVKHDYIKSASVLMWHVRGYCDLRQFVNFSPHNKQLVDRIPEQNNGKCLETFGIPFPSQIIVSKLVP